MSEGGPILPEISSDTSAKKTPTSQAPQRGILDILRKKFVLAAGVGLASGALGGAIGSQGCLPAESESDSHGQNEKVGSVEQAMWQATSCPVTWGQSTSNNLAPKVYWKDSTHGIALFSSDKAGGLGQADLYVSTTSDGCTWSPETLLDDSASVVKVNTINDESGAVLCAGAACGAGKIIFSSDRDGSPDLFWGDFDFNTLKPSNIVKIPAGGTKVNGDFSSEEYPVVDSTNSKIFFTRDNKTYTSDIGVWDKTLITGIAGANNIGPALVGSYLVVSVDSGCANVTGSFDLCRHDLSGTVASTPVNLNSVPGILVTPNDALTQATPSVDSKGNLLFASGSPNNYQIKQFDPIAGGTPDAGVDASTDADVDAGPDVDAGSDAGPDVDAGSDAGPDVDAGSDAGPDVDAGSDAGSDVDAGSDAGPDVDAGSDAGSDVDAGSDAGPDVDAGSDAGPDVDAGSDAGEGGSDGGTTPDCEAKVTGAASIQSCDESSAVIKMSGLGSISFADKKADITELVGDSCTFTVEFPNVIKLSSGFCAKELTEPGSAAVKYVDWEHGFTLGVEGSHTSTSFPSALNPNKSKGVVDVVALKAVESTHHLFKSAGCDSDNLNSCTPISTNLEGASQKNDIPEGSTLYYQIASGKFSGNPDDFKDAPVATPVEDGGGCTVSPENVSHDTKNALLLALGGLLIAARRSSRKGQK